LGHIKIITYLFERKNTFVRKSFILQNEFFFEKRKKRVKNKSYFFSLIMFLSLFLFRNKTKILNIVLYNESLMVFSIYFKLHDLEFKKYYFLSA